MTVAVLAPMPPELRPFVRRAGLTRSDVAGGPGYAGEVGGRPVVALRSGMGTARARAATERVLSGHGVEHVVVIGVAGGVGASALGDLVVPEVVVDDATGSRHRPAPFGDHQPYGVLRTTDELIVDVAVIARLAGDGVVALDMETSAVAQACEARGCPWSVFRGISDLAGDPGVDLAVLGMVNPDGSPNLAAVARYLARRPWRAPVLARLGRGMRAAADAAAVAAVRALHRPAD